MNFRERLGGHIRQLRKGRFLAQQELAGRSGISVEGLRRIERGQVSPSLDTVRRLAAALEISLAFLFAGFEAEWDSTSLELLELLGRMNDAQRRKALLLWMGTF